MGSNIGIVDVLLPYGHYVINEVVPEHVRIRVRPDIPDPEFVLEVMLHELGHVLGMGAHSICGLYKHLMFSSFRGIIQIRWPLSPISDEEAYAAKAIRNLPGDFPLDWYRVD